MPVKKTKSPRSSNSRSGTRSTAKTKSAKRVATPRAVRRPTSVIGAAMATRTPRPIDRLLIRAPEPAKKLACPLCGGHELTITGGQLRGSYGLEAHVQRSMVCERCRYVLYFAPGDSVYRLD